MLIINIHFQLQQFNNYRNQARMVRISHEYTLQCYVDRIAQPKCNLCSFYPTSVCCGRQFYYSCMQHSFTIKTIYKL